jgi:1,4-dihydroxy-2-naphthoate polyprenyltransferase
MTAETTVSPGSIRAWMLAARPRTLAAAVVPVAVGTACALTAGGARLSVALAALAGAALIQIGTNLANDAADFQRGADTADRVGPTRAAQAGLLSPRQLAAGAAAVFAAAMLCGLYLTAVAGWPIIAIGLVSIIAGIAYTAGPFPLAYAGLGDVFVIVFFGFVAVCGTAYAHALEIPPIAWWAAVPVGFLATALLAVNNLRDRETDARVDKRTLAVRFGGDFARRQYAFLLGASFATPLAILLAGHAGFAVLLPWATAPLAKTPLELALRATAAADLNRCLAQTARLLLLFGLALAAGIALGS